MNENTKEQWNQILSAWKEKQITDNEFVFLVGVRPESLLSELSGSVQTDDYEAA